MNNLPRYLLAAFFLALALGGGTWFVVEGLARNPDTPNAATLFPEPRPLPEFRLRDQSDQPFTLAELRGHTSLLFFGFTHCPDICPATLQQLALARRELAAADPGGPLPEILLISVDPERDTAAKLAQYVDYFGSGFTGVTGEPGELRSLTADLGVHFEKVVTGDEKAGDYTVNHSAAVFVIDPQARLQAVFSAPHDIESFVHDLPLIMSAR